MKSLAPKLPVDKCSVLPARPRRKHNEKACSELDAEGSGASHRALSRLEAAAVIVQSRVARGCAGRDVASKASERREILRQKAKLNWAASLLQTR